MDPDSQNKMQGTRPPTEQFLLFETWRGGFNNDRMSMESIYALAFLTQRTLVLPPNYYLYRLGMTNIAEYFEKEDMHFGVKLMIWEDFIKLYPTKLKSDSMKGVEELPDLFHEPKESHIIFNTVFCYPKVPDANTDEHARALKFGAGRTKLIDPSYFQGKKLVFFGERILLAHFYTWFWFPITHRAIEEYTRDVIRDHVHYPQAFLDVANGVIEKLPPSYVSFHIRRGDFQYSEQRHLSWDNIFHNTRNLLLPDEAIYVSTDEPNMTDIKPLYDMWEREGHKVYSFLHIGEQTMVGKTNPYYYGMIEQIVCARARTFVQTRLSTFSGYIQRLRMYMEDTASDNRILYTDSHYPSKYKLVTDKIPEWYGFPGWAREFFAAVENWDEVRNTYTA